MKKFSSFFLCLTVLFLLLTACSQTTDKKLTDKSSEQNFPSSKDGVTLMTEKEQYTTSADTITVMIENNSSNEFTTGTHLFLEKKVDGIWYEFPYKVNEFTEAAMVHVPGETSAMALSVDELKYELNPGEYRATVGGLAAPFEVVTSEEADK